MWALKQLHDKGLLYEGQRVLPYCWECETPLSNFETRLDDAYRQRQDPALTVWFELESGAPRCWCGRRRRGRCRPTSPSPSAPTSTTPCSRRGRDARYLLGEATVAKYAKRARGRSSRSAPSTGAELVGQRYTPLFHVFADTDRTRFVVLGADLVATDDGTGVVHLAPGFGEDDQAACEAAGIPAIVPGRRARPVHRRGARLRRPAGLRRQRPRSSRPSRTRASSSATRPTTTPTRTAGAPTRRSSTGPCRAGS